MTTEVSPCHYCINLVAYVSNGCQEHLLTWWPQEDGQHESISAGYSIPNTIDLCWNQAEYWSTTYPHQTFNMGLIDNGRPQLTLHKRKKKLQTWLFWDKSLVPLALMVVVLVFLNLFNIYCYSSKKEKKNSRRALKTQCNNKWTIISFSPLHSEHVSHMSLEEIPCT